MYNYEQQKSRVESYSAIGDFQGMSLRDIGSSWNSISSSLEDWEIISGIREIPISEFENISMSAKNNAEVERIRNLAYQIQQNQEIEPLLIVFDEEQSPYILEGSHRFDALVHMLNFNSVPAQIILDIENFTKTSQSDNENLLKWVRDYGPDGTDFAPSNPHVEGREVTKEIESDPFLRDMVRRDRFTNQFGWSPVDQEGVNAIKEFVGEDNVLEVGSGKGLFARLLQNEGVNVTATDSFSWYDEGNDRMEAGPVGLFTDVHRMDHNEAVQTHGSNANVLLMVWPPYNEPMAVESLRQFSGNKVIVIGEGPGGCVGDDCLWSELEENWTLHSIENLPRWSRMGIGNSMYMYTRNRKHSFGWFKKLKESEVSLYHGTTIDNKSSISEFGLIPDVGQFVRDAYESDYADAGIDLEDEFASLSFATDKKNLNVAFTAMTHHISKKLNKSYHDVTLNDIRNHGLMVKIKGEQGNPEPPSSWERRPEDYDQDWEMEASERGLHSVEPGDYYTEYPTGGISNGNVELIYGSSLIRFLRKYGLI